MQNFPRLLILSYGLGPIQMLVIHFGALLTIFTGLSSKAFLWAVLLYLVRMICITGIYHRLIIHKSYQAPASVKWLGCFIASSAGQMGPNWWKGHHLQEHHNHSDLKGDRHSPHIPYTGLKGFFWAQFGWLLTGRSWPQSLPADLEADWGLTLIDRFHFIPLILLGVISYWLGGLEFLSAFFFSTMILFHGVALVNSLAHLQGEQPFLTEDYSRNNWFVALVTLGEGWHNLHHAFQWSARHGFSVRDGKIVRLPDPTYWFIQILEKLHLASKLKLPSEAELLQAANKVSICAKIAST